MSDQIQDDAVGIRVQITDPDHPHFPEHGALTGKVISVLGTTMAEVKLDQCVHGTEGCFVRIGQIRRELVTTPVDRKPRAKRKPAPHE